MDPLESELEAMFRAADSGDLHEQVQHDVNFHRLIVEASGNETLIGVWRQLRVEARTFITALTTEIDLHKLAEMHRPVLEALAERDPDKAGRALRTHVETFGDLFLKGGSV
jgi:DNA-binding GntR family transcriptional regulator